MTAHAHPVGAVLRFPARLRVVAAPIELENALDALLLSGAIDERQHAVGLAYGRLRWRYDGRGTTAACRRSGGRP